MLDRADDTGEIVIRICTSGSGEARYVLWDPLTGEQTPVDGAEGESDNQEHDTDDTDGMLCAIANQVFISGSQDVQLDDIKTIYTTVMVPLARGPPLYTIAAAPLPARGPPNFLS